MSRFKHEKQRSSWGTSKDDSRKSSLKMTCHDGCNTKNQESSNVHNSRFRKDASKSCKCRCSRNFRCALRGWQFGSICLSTPRHNLIRQRSKNERKREAEEERRDTDQTQQTKEQMSTPGQNSTNQKKETEQQRGRR